MIKYLFLSILCVSICYSCVRNESLHEQESLIQPTLPQILNVVPTRVRLGTSRGTHISECGYGNNITLVNTKRFKDLYSPVYTGSSGTSNNWIFRSACSCFFRLFPFILVFYNYKCVNSKHVKKSWKNIHTLKSSKSYNPNRKVTRRKIANHGSTYRQWMSIVKKSTGVEGAYARQIALDFFY